ncbi:insulinase family protein [Gilvimarinus sp. SDUM040013]|uniref:Insulinase family protein n=1 Tax=Gilvimarinus gilvus TaxID=3058038 RepID=A0ABU4RWZ9_9GAMM|nr:insulinase family protein [Gilvimarinus sp. SDUM040013]MDO3385748.1 insulinase family protein [Gilvimarinus sp. SDUM040013]MDX6849388.1 insulinase family protein [Gilvimarinus sp. SDUM040013]
MSTHHSAFDLIRSERNDALNLTIEEYVHSATGAQHIHLASDNDENVFLVALRTVPEDSTGVAHILEHTALCGSKRFPVRDPFFMMTRRSLNTFMNAFTSSDWTAYPFASQNKKDFNNLLDVYLDAVFFATLDPLDFAQEGHRLDFQEPGNPESPLVFKGVVFNEMKGAMSSVPSQLWQKLSSHLFPSSTYHHNSGGDPEHIPDLSYEDLQAFYREHYHPTNATFMTFGNIAASEHQRSFEEKVLRHFSKLDKKIQVQPEKRLHSPVRIEDAYPLEADGEGLKNKTHIVIGWLLGKATDLDAALEAHLLSMVLLDNSASPLLRALEQSDLGQAPSPLCGLEDSQYEMSFVCGLEGCDESATADVEHLIFKTLEEIAQHGVPREHIESALHQLELSQREIGGDGFPYGLQLIMVALTAATHRGDTIAQMDLEGALKNLRKKVESADFVKTRVRHLLVDNTHRATLTLRPDAHMAERAHKAEVARLADLKATLTDTDCQKIIEQAEALDARQQQKDDESILPKVELSDVPTSMAYSSGSQELVGNYPLRCYGAGTNGLVYHQLVIRLPNLTSEQLQTLSMYCLCLTEVGHGELDYLAAQQRQAKTVGSLSARMSIRSNGEDAQFTDGYLIISAKALARNSQASVELMRDTFETARFDELSRIKELISQYRARREQSVTGNGHALAMSAASAGISPTARVSHMLGGLAGIERTIVLDNANQSQDQLAAFANNLRELHELLCRAPRQLLLVGEQDYLTEYKEHLAQYWQGESYSGAAKLLLEPVNERIQEGWLTNTQVNFCAKVFPTVVSDHPDAAPLTVLGGVLRNGFLHRTIREQGGAYGGGASQDNNIGAFRFYSYRDPRLAETLDDFDAAIEWLLATELELSEIEEAILGVVSSIDKPASPAGEAKQTFQAELFGRSREKREQFRRRVLEVTDKDLKRVTQHYLQNAKPSIAVVAPKTARETLEQLGLEVKTL